MLRRGGGWRQEKIWRKYDSFDNFIMKGDFRHYHCYVKVYVDEETQEWMFELLVYDAPTRSEYGNQEYSDDPDVIEHWEAELDNELAPMHLAIEVIVRYETPERMKASIKRNNRIYGLDPKLYHKEHLIIPVFNQGEEEPSIIQERKVKDRTIKANKKKAQ